MLIPLFPLDAVLFPGTRAPLHIFEDRYRAMLGDILARDGQFGLVAGAGSEPPPGSVGVVAQVVTHQPLEDGRSNILVEGVGRFVVQGIEATDAPYLVARVVPFDDEPGAPPISAASLRALRDLGARCRRAMATLADLPAEGDWAHDQAEETFQVAASVPWDPGQSAPFLILRSPAERADLLLRILPGVVPDLERRAAVHRRAGGNGHGPHRLGTA
jgi:Lon protease-like protein